MNQAEVLQQLQQIFDRMFLEPVVLTSELSADQVEEWDSFIQISLIVAVEKSFNVRFPVGEVGQTRNVGDFVQLIMKYQKS
ncbi:MAG: acyl carrier protein [Deltaproteobacteria bacterium]|nr:acyl carrier protein [Deltaproteobacteria bacterium]